MTWEIVKKYLQERNRIIQISNKGKKGYEIIQTWNGNLICEYSPDDWIRLMYRSGEKEKLFKVVLTNPPATIYDYWGKEHVHCGWLLPPDKNNKTPKNVGI